MKNKKLLIRIISFSLICIFILFIINSIIIYRQDSSFQLVQESQENYITQYSYSCKKGNALVFKLEYNNVDTDNHFEEILGYYEVQNNLLTAADQGSIELCMDFDESSTVLYCKSHGLFSKNQDFTKGNVLETVNQSFDDYIIDYTLKEESDGKYDLVTATNQNDSSSFVITVELQ